MGCWDETCALTGLGIHSGDPVVRVEAKYPERKLSWDIAFGIFDQVYDLKRVRSIMSGNYDDYGGLENAPRGDVEDDIAAFFFHEEAWQWALKEYDRTCQKWWSSVPALLNTDPFGEISSILDGPVKVQWPDRMDEFVKVGRICSQLRRPLIIPPSGPQTSWDSYDSQERLAKLVINKIERVRREADEWDSDED